MGAMIGSSLTLADEIRSARLKRLLADHHPGPRSVRMVFPSRRWLSAAVHSVVDVMSAPFPARDPRRVTGCLRGCDAAQCRRDATHATLFLMCYISVSKV